MNSPLADRIYRHLFLSQVIALAGTGLSTVALALLAYELAGSNAGAVLGTALAIKMIAYVFIAPIVGSFVDRLPRRWLLIALDIARAGLVGCLPFVTELWQIYLLIFLLNACSAGFTPTFQAVIPDILPDDARYTRALSLSRLAYDLENLLSPTLAAAALMVLGFNALFVANALTFLISALLVYSVNLPPPTAPRRDMGLWKTLSFGIVNYLRTPRLRGLLALSLATAAAGAMVIVNTVVYVRIGLGGTATDTALAFAAFGTGSMLAAFGLPRLLDKCADRPFMLAGGVLLAAGLALGLTEPDLPGLLLIWLLLGAGSSLIQTPAGRLLKRSTHSNERAGIFTAQFALSHLCWLLTYPVAGWAGATAGLPAAFTILAGTALAATTIAFFVWPADDAAELEHSHEPMTHAHPHSHDEHHQHMHDGTENKQQHGHAHHHETVTHRHVYIIDIHHPVWPEH